MTMMESIAAPASGGAIVYHPIPAPERLQVLVAEDDEFNQQVLRLMLERRGYRVRTVDNGRLALAALAEGCFGLLLVDVRMPEVDGFHVVESLRRSERDIPGSSRLPVIAVTAMAAKTDRERCMEAGADEYLSKPFRVAALYAALDRAMGGTHLGCRAWDVESATANPLRF
jgi:CheY-like chemotaxis protein